MHRFFPKSAQKRAQEILGDLTVDIGFIKVGVEDEFLFQHDPFYFMEQKLKKVAAKGIRPVLVLDEIQMLKDIYMNGEQYLIDKLFNLFVGLTKELHLAHVILLTSDSYFIEEIYNSAKLKKTTRFYFIDHFLKKEVAKWLASENFFKQEIEYVWEKLGGSVWEISMIIQEKQKGISVQEAVQYYLDDELGKLKNFLRQYATNEHIQMVYQINTEIAEKGYAEIGNYAPEVNNWISLMVEQDVWFFNTSTQQLIANSESIRQAMIKIGKR